MRKDWMNCDGTGGQGAKGTEEPGGTQDTFRLGTRCFSDSISRRGLVTAALLGAVAWAGRSALAQIAVSPKRDSKDVLVVVFLRGGADGLSVLVPYGEDAYHRSRPTLGIGKRDGVLDLDGFFGLNPALAPLVSHYREGRLALLHAVGSSDQTRSHFEAMNAMERGLAAAGSGEASGWLARHLLVTQGATASPLRAVAFGAIMPDSLRGGTEAIAIESLRDFRLVVPGKESSGAMMDAIADLYRDGKDEMAHAGRETLQVLETLNRLNVDRYVPSAGAVYPKSDLGEGLRQVALLIRSGLGLEVAALDKGGWDTHVAQGSTSGWLTGLLDDLGRSIAAFATDLGSELSRVTLVVMTEFGRRVQENSGLGTDHGRASFMMVLGGNVRGGKVHGRWPGLEPDQLEEPGDLRVTTDYRNVLAEILAKRAGGRDLEKVFPGLRRESVGIV